MLPKHCATPSLPRARHPATRGVRADGNLRRLWTMPSRLRGSTLNADQLAGELAFDVKSVARCRDLLVDLLLVRRLSRFRADVGERLVESPKVCVHDSDIVHTLLGLGNRKVVPGHPVAGGIWEGFVVETLLRRRTGAGKGVVLPNGRRRRNPLGSRDAGRKAVGGRIQAWPRTAARQGIPPRAGRPQSGALRRRVLGRRSVPHGHVPR